MKTHSEVAIIGGGINGLMTAFYLTQAGMEDITIFEERFIGSGQSSRNSGGVRAQFGNEHTVRFMNAAISEWRKMSGMLRYNILFHQKGYVFICFRDEDPELYAKQRAVQNAAGIHTEWLGPESVSELIPGLGIHVEGANFHRLDGTLHHDAVISALIFRLRERGVNIMEHTAVRTISCGNSRFTLGTERGTFSSDFAVNAAASHAPQLSAQIGIKLPITPCRRELIATEPLRHFLDPMVVMLKYGISFHQSLRGEIVSHTKAPEPNSEDIHASYGFLVRFARDIIAVFPYMRNVKVVRQWAGTYDITPDASPAIGASERNERFLIAAGSSGHGFMMAPETGKVIAEYIAHGSIDPLMRPFSPDRFERGELLNETAISGDSVL